MRQQLTRDEYSGFQRAYDFFNRVLFAGTLPQPLVTLQRRPKMRGYYWAEVFRGRGQRTRTDELALNPDQFKGRTDEQILSTLVHEMVHVWQHHYGAPSRRAYHNVEWAEKMKSVGLNPSSTGKPGGREVGEHVSHYIVPNSSFAVAVRKLQSRGFKLNWQSGTPTSKRLPTRTKFTCPSCGLNAWAKPSSFLACGECSTLKGQVTRLLSN